LWLCGSTLLSQQCTVTAFDEEFNCRVLQEGWSVMINLISHITEENPASFSLHIVNSSPVTVLEWPRGFQEDKGPRFHENGTGWW